MPHAASNLPGMSKASFLLKRSLVR